MKRFLPVLLLVVLGESALAAPAWIVFKGVADALYNNKTIYIKRFPGGSSWSDSAIVKNGKFEFRKEYIAPCVYKFYCDQNEIPELEVLAERPGVISINVEKGGLKEARIKGSFAQTVYEQFLRERVKLLNEKQSAQKSAAIHKSEALAIESIPVAEDDVTAPLALSYALKYPNTFAAAYILEGYGRSDSLAGVETAWYRFSRAVQESFMGQRLRTWLNGLESNRPGQTVADFSLTDALGNLVHFNDVKGKAVLIDFWASWCGPCREEFKLLRHVYEKHKDKGFTIISISVDASPSAWKKALQQEQLPWLQLLDETTGVDISGGRFGVSGLPTIFILDRNRKIVYRDLRGGVLDKVIADLVNE